MGWRGEIEANISRPNFTGIPGLPLRRCMDFIYLGDKFSDPKLKKALRSVVRRADGNAFGVKWKAAG